MLGEVFELTTAGLLTAATAPTVRLDCLNAFRIMLGREETGFRCLIESFKLGQCRL